LSLASRGLRGGPRETEYVWRWTDEEIGGSKVVSNVGTKFGRDVARDGAGGGCVIGEVGVDWV